MNVSAPASRNAPCPCGSGRRYKECHGALAAPLAGSGVSDRLASAARAAAGADFATVCALCEDVLKDVPGHPVALELLARCETEAGRPLAALALLLEAARGLESHPLPPSNAYVVWTALNAAFLDAVSAQGAQAVAERRAAYRTWIAERRDLAQARGGTHDVAVVLVLTPATTPEQALVSLDALVAQTLRPAQLIVASVGVSPALPLVRARFQLLPFESDCVAPPAPTLAQALDDGAARASATWIVALEPPHAFAPDHLANLVEAIAGQGARWGFAACTLHAYGAVPATTLAAHQAAHDASRTSLAKADSLGFAFIDQAFPPTGMGAVLFARELVGRVGGFRPLPGHELWDFCVRALWEDEPALATAPTYRHAVVAGRAAPTPAEREAAQVAIFREYYARACAAGAAAPNPHAPSLERWGLAFVRAMFRAGHVLMVDFATLERLRAYVAAEVAAAPPPALTPGINLLGFAFGEFGLGESLRALARACEAGGIPFVVRDIEQRLATRQADRSVAAHLSEDIRHRLSLMCVNPDMLKPVRPLLERTRAAGGYRVGYWYWELETTPRTWVGAYEAVDEIWCATEFVAAAVRKATDKPVIKLPPPIEVSLQRRYTRQEFGLPEGRFLFLFTFDYNSFVKRKNPEGVIEAFRAAFPRGRDDVGLVVKSVNGVHRPERVAAIKALYGDDPRIVHLDRFLSRDESYGLIDATDAYVSLHRAEGLGLGLAEAMALGKPAIATAYSGNLEFMNAANSLLVDYRLVPIAPGEDLVDDERFAWAEPDVARAARHMRALVDDPALRARIATAGQREVRERFGLERAAQRLRERLGELGLLDEDAPARPAAVPPEDATGAAPPFVSYAQNGEDALLDQVLAGVERGFYVDIGANDPDVHSVTRAFYERGWRGVNVEPVGEWHERLAAARARDVNLALAVAREHGEAVLHEFAGTGLSTLDAEVARGHGHDGRSASERRVRCAPLAAILDEHARGDIHFLKVDVEGAEGHVLAGADFARHRPWVVVVEATRPMTAIASHEAWEPLLLRNGYAFAFDDGLNRYYVSDEHADLARRFDPALRTRPVVRAAELAVSAEQPPAQRFDPQAVPFLDLAAPEPTLAQPVSQLCTAGQFREPAYASWCRAIGEPPVLRRKQWECVWILQCLEHAGMLAGGRRGLGFGCGREPLAAAMAARGCVVVATDLAAEAAAGQGWIETGQHARALADLNLRGVCPPGAFRERVAFRAVDMNAIPDDLEGFDFVWSSSAFEHLGSLDRGLAFVTRAMRCLKPGGIAVHTTEFNLSSNGPTLEARELCVYRRQDIERLRDALALEGHRVGALNLQPGRSPVDRFVDLPPYRVEPHIKLRLGRFVVSSIGLAIERRE